MKCNEIRELLSLYIDGMLEEDQLKIVEEHLTACEACRNEYNEMKEMLDLLGQADMVPVPDAFEFRLKKALKEEKQKMIESGTLGKPSNKKSQWRIITSVAAVFAVGVLSFGLYHDVLDIVPDQLNGTEQSDLAQAEKDGDSAKSEIYSFESGDNGPAPCDSGDDSVSMKQQPSAPDYAADSSNADASGTDDEEIKMFIYGAADGAAPESTEPGSRKENEGASNATEQNSAYDMAGSSEEILRSKLKPTGEDCSRSLTAAGVERNAAAIQYYDNLIQEKLKDFDYQILESCYTQTGEWQFRIFIFRGKDGNTYNEEIRIIGKDGEITIVQANEFMRL